MTGSPAAVGRALRSLSPEDRRAFLADLYAARGYDVERAEGGLVASAPPERVVVAVPGTGDPPESPDAVLALPSRWPTPGGWAGGSGENPDGPGTRTLDAETVDGMLRHAVDRGTADALCRTHFGDPLAGLPEPREFGLASPSWLTTGRVTTALALVVVVAGFAALIGPANPAETFGAAREPVAQVTVIPTQSGVAAGTTTATATTRTRGIRGSTLAPGLGSNGVRDVDDLADAHADWLTGRSYRWELSYREYVDGNPTATANETVTVEGATVYRTEPERAGSVRVMALVDGTPTYADGRHRYQWFGHLDRRSFSRSAIRPRDREEPGPQAARAGAQVRSLLDVEASTVVGSTRVGEDTRFFLSGGGTDRPGVENYSVSALVDRNGVVRELRVDYELPEEGVRVVYTFHYEAVGATTVEAPVWYEEARNATTGDGRFP